MKYVALYGIMVGIVMTALWSGPVSTHVGRWLKYEALGIVYVVLVTAVGGVLWQIALLYTAVNTFYNLVRWWADRPRVETEYADEE